MSQSIPTWCWYCKQEIPTVADVCPYCGKPLNDATKVVRCQKCGKFLLKSEPRCTQCGEPAPQPEPPAPPDEPPAQGGEADAPPSSAQDAEAPEMLRMFDELERLSAQSRAAKNEPKGNRRLAIIVVLALVVGVGALLGVSSIRARQSGARRYCDEDKHQWIEADCTTPKTCAVCGKTEGEAEGHVFVENVCAVCGEYAMLFYFTNSDSERSGGEVIFRGNVKNFAGVEVQSLQITLQLYDGNKTLVATLPAVTMETGGLAPFESTPWQIRYNDSSVAWKYWRAYVEDYSPKP